MALRFIDLYAGLGGFHQALNKLDHKCVMACEKNNHLLDLYQLNYPNTPVKDDIFKLNPEQIPEHDVLTAGFPCQPFSRSGYMEGFNDLKRGNHFFKLLDIIDYHKTEYLILENVDTIKKHDNGNTFRVIKEELIKRGYDIAYKVLSPHQFNIPQIRKRLFIVARRADKGGLDYFRWPEECNIENTSINSLNFECIPGEKLELNKTESEALLFWEEFVLNFPNPKDLPSFPLWPMEFGANYEYRDFTPFHSFKEDLVGRHGSFGEKIPDLDKDSILKDYIPKYSQVEIEDFPVWKKNYIKQNRAFYLKYKDYIDDRMENLKRISAFSYQKFEWSCKGEENTFDDKIIQFRPSGIRVSRNRWVPTLTTIKTQNIYLKKIDRRLSLLEHIQLQSLKFDHNPNHLNGGYKALGNSVNVDVVYKIAKNLFYAK